MIETDYGPGVYGASEAGIPGAPRFASRGAGTIRITLDPGENGDGVEYLVRVTAAGVVAGYVQDDGSVGSGEVWHTVEDWEEPLTITGLARETGYTFAARARNAEGVENPEWGPESESILTWLHVRRQIREAVVGALAGIAAFGGRVYPYRTRVATAVPEVTVMADEEKIDYDDEKYRATMGSAGLTIPRKVTLTIVVKDKSASELDNRLDGYAAAIEAVMAGQVLQALAVSWLPESMRIGMAGDTETDTALMKLTWAVVYRTVEGNPYEAVL